MWCRTPFFETEDGAPQNHDRGDLACLLTRIQPLLNEQWPDHGVDAYFRSIEAPGNRRQVCLVLRNVPEKPYQNPPDNGVPFTSTHTPFNAISIDPPSPVLAQWVEAITGTLPGMAIGFTVDAKSDGALGVPAKFQREVLEMQKKQGDDGVRRDPCGGKGLHWFVPKERYDPGLPYRVLLKIEKLWHEQR